MRYLVGLTADRGGRDALALGRMLARSGDIALTVCVVTPETWGHPSPARVDAEYAQFLSQHAGNAIAEARDFLGEGTDAEYVSRAAPSATEGLTSIAEEVGATMIILGSARHGPLGRFTVGGVTNELLHSAPVPIALAPRGFAPSSDARLERITCAFAGSTRSRTSFDASVQLCARHDIPLRLASLVVRDRQMYPSDVGYDAEKMVEEEWRKQATEAQGKALRTLPDDIEAEAVVAGGRDWEDALDSLSWGNEILVVGSSRLGPVRRVFLGSNSTKIVRSSPVPVVVIPRGAEVRLAD